MSLADSYKEEKMKSLGCMRRARSLRQKMGRRGKCHTESTEIAERGASLKIDQKSERK